MATATVADPAFELTREPSFDLLALLAFLRSVISSFSPKIRGAQALQVPTLDLQLR